MVFNRFFIQNFFLSSITFRIIILVACIVILFGSLGITIAISSARKKLTHVIHKQQLAFSEYISNDINTEINKSLSFFTDLAKELSKKTIEKIVLKKGRHIPPNFKHGIILFSPDGKLIAEYPVVQKRKDLLFFHSEWFQRAKKADTAIMSKPFKNRITQEPSIVFAAPIKKGQDELIAIVAGIVGLKQPELFRHIYTSKIGRGGGFLVVSPRDKLFIASNIPEMVLTPTPAPGKNPLHDKAMAGYRGVGVTVNAYGVEELAAIASIESTEWFVVVRMPVEEAYMPVKQLSKSLISYNILLACMVVSILIIALVAILTPLKNAALSARQMASGKKKLSKLPVIYKDEVGDLTQGFNDLVNRIDERTSHLKSAKKRT